MSLNLEFNPWVRKKVMVFLILLVLPMVVLEIWAVNRLSTYGIKISQLEDTKSKTKLDNDLLEAQIARDSSLLRVSDRSTNLGLERIRHFLYL